MASDTWDPNLRGIEYKPYLTVRTPSHGKASRIPGLTTGRLHHTLSQGETAFFYLQDWALSVVDIREQFALPLDETRAIADELGVVHPTNPRTRKLVRMTSDFVLTVLLRGETSEIVRTYKPSADLASRRTLEKLEIERRYWRSMGREWLIVTEREIPSTVVQNIAWVHSFRGVDSVVVPAGQAGWLMDSLHQRLRENHDRPIATVCSAADESAGFQPGTHLALVRHALANRRWSVDMHVEISGHRPLTFLDAPPTPEQVP